MEQPVLHLEKIKLNKQNKTILEVDKFQVNEGEIIGVVGPNGAGKSTLIKIMSFLEKPSSGSIYFNGGHLINSDVDINLRREIAVVFQQPLMFDTTVYNNVAASLQLRRVSKNVTKEKVEYWLRKFGIEHLAKRYARTLSGGEVQRVALARAMVYDPKILFMDEPFTALDSPSRKKLLQDFKSVLSETKTTTIFVSHDYQEIKYLCSEMVILFEGRMIQRSGIQAFDTSSLPRKLALFLEDWMKPLVT